MKIQPIASPHAMTHAQTTNNTDVRARAMAKFMGGEQPHQQETPVADPNQVSAEELSAIQPARTTVEQVDNNSNIETAKEETPAEPQPQEQSEKDPAISRQFAQLARQERALRAKQQQQEAQFKQREAELAAREAKLAQTQFDPSQYVSKAKLKQDALGVLEAEGITTYDELTQRALTRQAVDPVLQNTIDALRAEISELKQANTQAQENSQKAVKAQYDAAIRQITSDAKALVQSDPDAYEAIVKTGTVKEVVKLIERTYEKTGEIMSVEDAAAEVENYLVEENLNMAKTINKIQKRLTQDSARPKATEEKTQATPKQTQPAPMKTLTNAASSSRKLSAKERAILAFKGQLGNN